MVYGLHFMFDVLLLPPNSAAENNAHPGDDEHAAGGYAGSHILPDPRGRPAGQLSLGAQWQAPNWNRVSSQIEKCKRI